MKFLKPSFKNLSGILCLIYVLILFCIYPFYMKEGYVDIGAHKYYFFLYSSVGAVVLLSVSYAVLLLNKSSDIRFALPDIFTLLFMIETVLSFCISDFKSEAYQGADGWFMGLVTLLIVFGLYLLISRLWLHTQWVFYPVLIVSFAVYLLGILDRFSIYIIPLKLRNPSFISTLGNINWFMGYYSVLTPVGAGLFMYELDSYTLSRKERKHATDHSTVKMTLLSVYVLTAFMAGFAQGSESVLLFDAALFLGILYFCYKKIFKLEHFFLLPGLWGVAAQGIRLMRVLLPEGYNYETDSICARITGNDTAFVLGVVCLFICYGLRNFRRNPSLYEKLAAHIIRALFACVPAAVLIWLGIGLLRTNTQLFPDINSSLFIFNESFGSGRGEAYKTAFLTLREMPLKNILFGAGPDCFAPFVYSIPSIADELRSYWVNDTLTNAHCEMLTMLINQGICGVILYAGFFISYITYSCKKEQNTSAVPLLVALSVFCYLVHNLISFATVLNLPFVVVLMGIGRNEAQIKS